MVNYVHNPEKQIWKCGDCGLEVVSEYCPDGWNLSDSEPHYWMCNKCQHDADKYSNWDDFIPPEKKE